MNAFALARLTTAIGRIDQAVADLRVDPEASKTVARLLEARGDLIAMEQLLELEDSLTEAVPVKPANLRVVK